MRDSEFEAAKRAAIGVEEEIRSAEGGSLTEARFGTLLGIGSIKTIRKYRAAGRILAWKSGRSRWLYPAWQIHRGKLLPGLSEVLAVLNREKGLTPFSIAVLFIYPSDDLGEKSPLQLLRANRVADVVAFARRYGDIGT